MARKLILTSFLSVLYQGSVEHLAGSLMTIFLFLLAQMLLKPYLNQGLNIFQVMMHCSREREDSESVLPLDCH